ncbi:hypothetical protein [Grimontia hollisae]|uniref:hypothetical protein n=1 Tax=Grimontia hollisae TaxID=673 RepID=UPI001E562E74|nr:hypothetical protein [Grimontia hollisae]
MTISAVLFTVPALAFEQYAHCFKVSSTEVWKAFFAGLEITQSRPERVEKAVQERSSNVDKDTFLGRALEQRAGGRYKTSTMTHKD